MEKYLFRAADPAEYDDLMVQRRFRISKNSLVGKQFGFSLEETLRFADQEINRHYAAIIRIMIPQWVFEYLKAKDDSHPDRHLFRSGTLTVADGPDLDLLNNSLLSLKQVM